MTSLLYFWLIFKRVSPSKPKIGALLVIRPTSSFQWLYKFKRWFKIFFGIKIISTKLTVRGSSRVGGKIRDLFCLWLMLHNKLLRKYIIKKLLHKFIRVECVQNFI